MNNENSNPSISLQPSLSLPTKHEKTNEEITKSVSNEIMNGHHSIINNDKVNGLGVQNRLQFWNEQEFVDIQSRRTDP